MCASSKSTSHRKRIALTMRSAENAGARPRDRAPASPPPTRASGARVPDRPRSNDRGGAPAMGAFGAALAEAMKRK